MQKHVLVIKGGSSSERAASLVTGKTLEDSLQRLAVRFESIDIKQLEELYVYDLSKVAYVFIALHGGFGENGDIQRYLHKQGIPYNGANSLASIIGINKQMAKKVAESCGINVPKGILIEKGITMPSYEELESILGKKIIIKPCNQGCSVGVHLVENSEQYYKLIKAHDFTSSHEGDILIEKFISGNEIALFHLHGYDIPIISVLHDKKFFSFDAKFNSQGATRFTSADLDAQVEKEVRDAAESFVSCLGIKDYCRFDFILNEKGVYFIEINTLPGLVERPAYVEHSQLDSIDTITRSIMAAKLSDDQQSSFKLTI